jgi:hypothetical protein
MEPEDSDFANDPLDDELDAAVLAAAELIAHAKTVGLAELQLPVVDESNVWAVTVKKMGIDTDE